MIPWFLRRCHVCRWPLALSLKVPVLMYLPDGSPGVIHLACWRKFRPTVNP